MAIWKFQKPSDSLLVTDPAREIPSYGRELFDAVRMGEMFTAMSTSRRRTTSLTLKSLDADERFRKLTGENFPVLEDDMEAAFQRARELDETFPDYEEFLERRSRIANYYLKQAAKAQTYTTTDWPVALGMAAAAYQAAQDPMVLASMLVAPASIPGAFAAGMAMELPLQGMVYQWHKDIGAEYSEEKALMTAFGAGVLGAGFEGISRLLRPKTLADRIRESNDKPFQLPPPRKPSPGRGPSPASEEPFITEPPPRAEAEEPTAEQTFEEASGPEAEPIVPEPPPRAEAEQTFEEASEPEAEPIIPPKPGTEPPPTAEDIAAAKLSAHETRAKLEELQNFEMTPELEAVIRQEQDYLASLDATIATERPIRRDKVAIPLTNKWFSVRYEVVELDELVTSDMPGFDPDLQPRDRTQQESVKQVQEIVDIFDPYQLLANPHTDRGAPIIGYANNMVESGNGRVMAMRKITPEQMAEYRKALGEFLGYEVEGKVPILVRRRDDFMSKAELIEYTRKSNRPTGAAFDSRRNVEMVGEKVPISVLNMYQGGGIETVKNARFVREWLSYVHPNDLPLYSQGGKLTEQGAHEIELFLMSKAYKDVLGGEQLLQDILLANKATNTEVGFLLNMMRNVAGDVALLRHTVTGGQFEGLDIAADLVYAVNTVNRARTEPGMSIEKMLKIEDFTGTRTPEIEALIQLMNGPVGTVREVVEEYIERALKEASQGGADVFGTIISKEELLSVIKRDIPTPTPGKGGKKAKGKTAGGGDGEAQAKASQEAEGPIQPVAKTQATEDEIFLQAEVSAEIQEYIANGGTGKSPFQRDLGEGFSYFERGQKVMDDMFGTADVPPVDNPPMNSVAGRENVPPPGKAASEEEAMKGSGDNPDVQMAKKEVSAVTKCSL